MPCEGYEHGQKAIVIRPLKGHEVPIGTIGIVEEIHTESHTIDVLFAKRGLLLELDPHCFTTETAAPTVISAGV